MVWGNTDRRNCVLRWLRDTQKVNRVDSFESLVEDFWDVTPTTGTPVLHAGSIPTWTDQEAEDYLALPQYNHLQVSAEREDFVDNEKTMQSRSTKAMQGDAPSRRYSAPTLPTFTYRLSSGALEWAHRGHFDVPCKSCMMERKSKSVDELQ